MREEGEKEGKEEEEREKDKRWEQGGKGKRKNLTTAQFCANVHML